MSKNHCSCRSDGPDLAHWNPQCFKCQSKSIGVHAICDCMGQCGHQLGVWCNDCNTKQMPMNGQGWCTSIKTIKTMLKPGKCIMMGCQKTPYQGHPYCGKFCATKDGAL